VALQADRVHRGAIEQAGIWSAVRRVACRATLGLDDGVFVYKRTGRFSVALGADRIHLRGGSQVLPAKRPMRIMAVSALDQALFHLVMERHVELRLDVGVALEAQLRLRDLEQVILVFAHVNAVATDAAYVGFAMSRTLKVGVLTLVATKTLLVNFLGRSLAGVEDLGYIASTIDVRLARTMATLAGYSGLAVCLGQLGVWIGAESL